MKIALCSTYVPHIHGGARNIVEWLQAILEEHGHQVERIYLPQVDSAETLIPQMMAMRWVDVSAADRIICFRPSSHLIPHRHKILWFIHHVRVFYDLWDSEYRPFPDDLRHRGIRAAVVDADTAALMEAKAVFTNSQRVADRVRRFNGVASEVLYPPVFQPERFHSLGFNDEVVCVSRLEHHKRQHLLVEALAHTRTPVRLRLAGAASADAYARRLKERAAELGLADRVIVDGRWISEEEKIGLFANCLASAYVPLDEDSYGYPSVEASHSGKASLTTTDSGGVTELVEDGLNGFVAEPTPEALGEALDRLYLDRHRTEAMGRNARERLDTLGISWQHVVARLLA